MCFRKSFVSGNALFTCKSSVSISKVKHIFIRILLPADCQYLIYSQAKNQHFRPAGATRCTNSCEIWHDRGASGSAWPSKISRQSVPGWERGPQNGKNFHFLLKSRPAGTNPLTDFYSCQELYTHNYPALAFYI